MNPLFSWCTFLEIPPKPLKAGRGVTQRLIPGILSSHKVLRQTVMGKTPPPEIAGSELLPSQGDNPDVGVLPKAASSKNLSVVQLFRVRGELGSNPYLASLLRGLILGCCEGREERPHWLFPPPSLQEKQDKIGVKSTHERVLPISDISEGAHTLFPPSPLGLVAWQQNSMAQPVRQLHLSAKQGCSFLGGFRTSTDFTFDSFKFSRSCSGPVSMEHRAG